MSKNEQKNAGLDNCTHEEYAFFDKMNNEFKLKFNIPFSIETLNISDFPQAFKKSLICLATIVAVAGDT